ncbi:MAG: helix-turn-helix domain-containing protein [Oscillospiraceae bacterium]|nr:helix-turn-helix domain-containing protein [Oscillospiraceae bacterium]
MIALLEHDQQKETEYIKTLDTYLWNETHITQTTEALYIHRSSLIKRLDKIQRLLGDDLNDTDVRLYYRICLALINSRRQ